MTPQQAQQMVLAQRPTDIIREHVFRGLASAEDDGRIRDWQQMPELPLAEELMGPHPLPLPTFEGGAFSVKEDYLEAQYLMTRSEGTELLRKAINEFRKSPNMMEGSGFYIYTQVHVQGYLFARAGPACRISLSTERSPVKVNWSQSGRLNVGTSIVLSTKSDAFRTQCYVGIVAGRGLTGGLEPEDDTIPPSIEIFWADCQCAILDPSIELVMLEATGGYYEAVRHAMVGLQHAAQIESKFDKYLINGSRQDQTAQYLQECPGQLPRRSPRADQLDVSQEEAFSRMVSKELAIVQGPPGTGKTFTSVVALDTHVRTLKASFGGSPTPPVIVSAQTNHALDQLLTRCLSFDAVILRLGGRTEEDLIKRRTLYSVRENSKFGRGGTKGDASRKALIRTIQEFLSTCFPSGLISAAQFRQEGLITDTQKKSLDDNDWECAPTQEQQDEANDPIKIWLGDCVEPDRSYIYRPPVGQTEPPTADTLDANLPQDENRDRLYGSFVPTEFYWTGKTSGTSSGGNWCFKAKKELKRDDLYDIKPQQRGLVYRYLRKMLIEQRASRFPKLLGEYERACKESQVGKWDSDVKVIQHEKIEILGCTATGLTKYRGLIAALKPRILMVEEAAETREANITSALYPSLDQVVLVGDHQQLVPSVDVRDLEGAPFHLNVSLFERLVGFNIPYTMLRIQRRMIPDLREIVHTFYPKLEDHESVKNPKNREPVPGMGGKNLWWFDHSWAETFHDAAYSNPSEAEMVVKFTRYLLKNGVRPPQITVLTFYRGQVALLLDKLRNDPLLADINPTQEWSVRTVDGFQGEENEVIILSLVRSPENGRARSGFVANENRAVVALSRARCGMYIFGNCFNVLNSNAQSQETWQKVIDVFKAKDAIGKYLPVVCRNHSRVTEIKELDGWDDIPGGGCRQPCDEKCLEGHSCPTTCHPTRHTDLECTECQRIALAARPPSPAKIKRLQAMKPTAREPAEPTVEDFMEDYHSYSTAKVGKTLPSPLANSESLIPSEPLILGADWSSRCIEKKDQEISEWQKELRIQREREARPTHIEETYRPTVRASNQSRVIGSAVQVQHTIPGPSWRAPEPTYSESSIEAIERPSRKHLLLDAAAGFYFNDYMTHAVLSDNICSVNSALGQCRLDGIEDAGVDLIDFD